MTWSDYVAGRSIAVVGPAPITVDQSADIDGHDLVYRTTPAFIGGLRGDRVDIAFLNGGIGRTIYDDENTTLREPIEPAAWWVHKGSATMQGRRDGNWRVALKPKRQGALNRNQVTAILFDLVQFDTGPITVFGADLYAAGPGASYEPDYDLREVAGQASGFLEHDPMAQMRLHRSIHETGRVVGDDRYLAAVTMTDAEYQAVIDRWRAVLEEAEG